MSRHYFHVTVLLFKVVAKHNVVLLACTKRSAVICALFLHICAAVAFKAACIDHAVLCGGGETHTHTHRERERELRCGTEALLALHSVVKD